MPPKLDDLGGFFLTAFRRATNPNEMIDTTFDFRTDTPTGKDPDTYSPTLRRYHKLLWSKPLPSGKHFELSDTVRGSYLHHQSALGEFRLASDTVIPSFRKEKSLIPIFEQLPEGEMNYFNGLGYTMGGMMIFPAVFLNKDVASIELRSLN